MCPIERGKQKRITLPVLLIFVISACIFILSCTSEPPSLPETPKIPVTEVYHDVEVTEDYRWLENYEDDVVREWSEQQNRNARAVLDGISCREAIHGRLEELLGGVSEQYSTLRYRQGLFLALFH